MTPPGKIINIDAFKQKDESFSSLQKNEADLKGEKAFDKKGYLWAGVFVVTLSVCLAYLVLPAKKSSIVTPPVNSIASANIKAPENLLIADDESTQKKRREAKGGVLDVYDFDDKAKGNISKAIRDAFNLVGKAYLTHAEQAYKDTISEFEKIIESEQGISPADEEQIKEWRARVAEAKLSLKKFEQSEGFKKLESDFASTIGVKLDVKTLQSARYYHYWPHIGEVVINAIEEVYSRGIISSKAQLPASAMQGFVIKRLSGGKERKVRSLESIYDIAEASQELRADIGRHVPSDRPGLRNLTTKIALGLLLPNLSFNLKETQTRKEAASSSVEPVFFQIQRGEMIVREGDRITASHVIKLQNLSKGDDTKNRAGAFAGLFVVCLFIVMSGAFFVRKFHEEVMENRKLQILTGALLLLHIGLIWGTVRVAGMFIPQTPDIGLETYLLAAPLVFGPMIISIFFTAELTILFTIVTAALTGLLLRDFSILPLLTVMGGMICAYQVRTYQKRLAPLKVGLFVALVNVVITLAYTQAGSSVGISENPLISTAYAFAGGALAGLLVSGALPLIEGFFPVVSDIKLLELTNLNHPLLRRMIMEAPGSYHHSIMVGYLAEEAAKSIDANPLLAKAGALFHDIGKMKKQEYFVENHRQGEGNPHDNLTPSMSTLIIINHIKEGQELAKKHKLLPQISAMIPEHHGTQLVKYFYNKAKEAEDETRADVKESDFRYPGPIPASRESACVAMADSIEAAARTCSEPTPLRLMGIVTDVINDKFTQGQLDNSHLTLRDLALIADSFVHVLTSIYHHRIAYPEPAGDKEKKAANAGSYSDTQKKAGPQNA